MDRVRTTVTVVFAMALALPSPAAAQTREFNETVPLAAGGRLRVDGSKGSITITSWDREEVEIRARIEASSGGDAEYARRALDATTVDVTGTSRSVSIRSNYDDVPRRSRFWGGNSRSLPDIHYVIRAPRRLDLYVESDRGPTALTGFDGRITLDADRGDVDLRDLTGEIQIAIDRGSESQVAAIRGAFDIEVDRTNIRMHDVLIENDSRLEIDRGDIEIEVGASQGLTLRADLSRRATFDSELPLMLSSLDGEDFRGTINGGGPELFIESDRGSVRLTAVP